MSSLWSWLGRKHPSKHPWHEERAQLIYGLASMAFSTTLLVYVYSALYAWATSRFAFAGLIGFAMFSTFTLKRTAGESVAGLRAVATRVSYRKYRNGAILAVLLLIVFFVHYELTMGTVVQILVDA